MQLFILNDKKNLTFLKNITKVLIGGEPFPKQLLSKLKQLSTAKIYNMYGPTETAVWSSFKDLTNENLENITIGKPIYNTQFYILDNNLRLLPFGVMGDIFISGDGVSNGYLNRQDLTEKAFIENPFIPNTIMYKTGDIGMYSNTGDIICLGRADNQVKMRGLRIELGEIEDKINELSFINSSVVIKEENDKSHEFLCAYYTSNENPSPTEIRKHIEKFLPSYMVPQYFVKLENFPYTPNGKIDKKKLPKPQIENVKKEIVLPRNDIDEKLIKILENLFNTAPISIDDSFFNLGGDSLYAINLSILIQDKFNINIFSRDIIENPIIQDLSDEISKKAKSNNAITLEKIPKADFYPLSSAQKRIYYASKLAEENNILYNITGSVIVKGNIDVDRLEKAFKVLINRHESLRTKFVMHDEDVVTQIISDVDFKLDIEKQTVLKDFTNIYKKFIKPFNLSEAPLFRAKFIKFTNDESVILVDMHHIISDGTSVSILIDELCKLYNGQALEKIEYTYKDFAYWESEAIKNGKFEKAEEYWVNQFKDEIPVLNMPTSYSRPAIKSYQGSKVYTNIDTETLNKINDICKKLSITPYMLLLSVYYVLLSKYTNQDDIIVGSPIVGRSFSELYSVIGMFVNTLPIRAKVDSKLSFKDFLINIKQICLENYKYQDYPLNELINKLNIRRDTSRMPLFDTLFVYQNKGLTEVNFEGIKSRFYIPDTKTAKYDISLEIIPQSNELSLNFEYCTQLFTKQFIENMANHYKNILNEILDNIDVQMSSINMLSKKERDKILYEFNDTKIDYPKDKTITQLFEEQVEKTPDNIAVVFENRKLTYKQLNEKSNQLAHYLSKNFNIEIGDIIPIIMDRNIELIISMLATIKLGCTYLPISVDTPLERINYIIDDSKANLAITNNKNDFKITTVNIDNINYFEYSSNNLNIKIHDQNILYIIYTSGSTGNPKGVKVCHKNLKNFLYSFNNLYNVSTKDKLLASTNISFDVSIFELFMPLINGASLYLYDETIITDIFKFCKNIYEQKITFLYIPPNILELVHNILLDYDKVYINKILIGVEPIKNTTIQKYYNLNPNLKIINAYGPTETTICATAILLNNNILKNYRILPIGKPLPNLKMFILDKYLNPVPIGIAGELYISGDSVSNGYLNNKKLTDESFIELSKLDCKLAYKTGDLAKWDDNGIISFVGRNDNQIKINGHRIELGEIEQCIYSYPNINKALVILQKNKLLCYFVATKKIDINDLKSFIKNKLPLYFVPNFFIQVEQFQLTSNGKIDRKALSLPEVDNEKIIVKPRNKIDDILLQSIEKILNIDINKISIEDNFFDIGGDSLSAINLCAEIYSRLNLEISVRNIMENSAIYELSNFISANVANNIKNNLLEKIPKSNYYCISSKQKNIYIASRIDGENSLLYNISGGVMFDKTPDIKKLKKCFDELIIRHESLRTYFDVEEDTIVQKILSKIEFNLEVEESTTKEINNELKNFIQPFDFSKAPLFRAKLLIIDDGKAVLFIDMHHIISDGTSVSILIDELCKLYNGQALEKIEYTYKDFAYWESEAIKNGKFEKAEEYWVNQFKDEIPVLNMPTSYSRPAIKSYQGSKVYTNIDTETLNKINDICKKLSITPYMLLLSVYYVLLSKYTNQDDIIVGSPIVGRSFSELYSVIGMFVNTLPIRAKVDSKLSFKDFLINIKQICLENYKYQDYPLNELINKLNIRRDTSRMPLFDTLFVYQNKGLTEVNFEGIKSRFYIPDTKTAKYDISLEIIPQSNELSLNFEYCTQLFTKQFIENMANHYKNILNEILDNIDVQMSSINMLSKKERDKILYEFNDTKIDYPKDKTITQLFEEQVEKTPDNIAVVFENRKLTYKQLNEKSNQLAHYLIKNDIKRGDIVGIMVNRSLEMMISILAVLKTGGTYIPIDPEYPQDRIEYMLNNSNAKILLTFENIENKVSFENKLFVELSNKKTYSLNKNNIENKNEPDDSSYIIYTSGSTGLPKGVVLKHKSLTNLQKHLKDNLEFFSNKNRQKTIVSVTTVSFDIFLFETIISLTAGLKVVICNEEEQYMSQNLYELLEKNKIEIIQMTPSRMQIFLDNLKDIKKLSNIKYAVLAGEALPNSLVKRLKELGVKKVYNGYGPSETTVFSTFTDVTDLNNVNIGIPLANTQIYILDKNLLPCPINVPGELFISGDGLGNGYLNRPDLNKNLFIPNPFVPDSLMYKTGDFCKYLPSGEIEYIERIDNQVKIRGLRIELGEIETKISSFPGIKKACVIKQNMNNRDFISAYFTIKKRVNIAVLRKHLSNYLPKYMIPSYFTVLEDFPYTPNGKINKKALPLPKEILSNSSEKYVAPKTDLQLKLTSIFEQVLETAPIGINDNFFELGGDSLLAMNLNMELSKITNKISYSDIFRFPTILELESKINSIEEDYNFKYMEQNYTKYAELLNNQKIPKVHKLKYKESKNILLTGVTGFLGIHILESFIKNEKGKIYCIIRNETGLTARLKLQQKLHYYFGNKYDKLIEKRIFAITGDICSPKFGLNQEELLQLSGNVDIVINSAANVSHYGNYTDFYNVNVKSVRHMLDFCKSFDKTFYQVSTLSVSGNSIETSSTKQNIEKETTFAENNLYIGQSLENVYVRSKFEAECLVLDAIMDGLDAYILRMGNLMPRYRDGLFQENILENAYLNKIISFAKIGAIPEYLKDIYLEFTPIDIVSNAIIKLITHKCETQRIFHLFNHNHVYLTQFLKNLNFFDLKIELVDEEIFKKIVRKMLKNSKTKEDLNFLMNDFDKDLHLVYFTDIIVKSENTIKYLEKTGFSWPSITERYLMNFINLLRRML